MPAIKPRTRQKHFVGPVTRLYRENDETLFSVRRVHRRVVGLLPRPRSSPSSRRSILCGSPKGRVELYTE